MTAIGPKTLELPTQVVLNLLEFAGRAPLLRPEWLFLEEWEGKIKQAIAAVQQQNQEKAQAALAAAQATPAAKTTPKQEPFDPNTPRAERRRAQRAAKRAEEKQAKVDALVGKQGDALAGEVGTETPAV